MIISSQHVESQNDLIIELEKAGISIGQATLSRDLKQLRVSKVRMPNGRCMPSPANRNMPPFQAGRS